MKQLENIITNLAAELDSLFVEYEQLDDISPLSLPIIKDIKKHTTNTISQLKRSFNDVKKELKELNEHSKNILKDHKDFKSAKLNYLKDKNKAAKDRINLQKDTINTEIANIKSSFEIKKKNKLLDIEFYVTGSYQHIEMFEEEYKESINRFSYQVQNAKQSYLDSIVSYNETLEKRINKINKEYKTQINRFIKENASIIKSYKAKIKSIEDEYSDKNEEFKHEIVSIKENRSNETINLNNQIRGLISIREQDTALQVQKLQEKKNTLLIERENKKKNQQLESQRIARDFATKMNEHDEELTTIRKEYDYNVKLLSNKHTMYLINITRENEKDLKQIYAHFDFKELPLSAKQTVRKINKHYQKIVKSHEISTNKEIKKLSVEMQLAIEKNNLQKKLSDLDRQYSLLILNEADLKDNKYYQETENSFDAEHRYNLKAIISRYNKAANITRRESSIKAIRLEALLDQTEAKYQKELESISSKIKNVELEIEFTEKLKDMYLNSEQEKHQKLINFLTVSSLLEIEKCKLLNNYNITTYELNVLNAKKILDYSIEKLELQNQKFEAIETKKIAIEALKINNEAYNATNKIQLLDIELNKEYKINEAITTYDIVENANQLLYEKYRIDLKKIGVFYSLLISFKTSIDEIAKYIITKLSNDCINKSIDFDIANGLIFNTFKLIKNEMIGYLDIIQTKFFEIINERLMFIQEFKFEPLLSEKKKAYEHELVKLNEEKNKLNNQIVEISKYIDNNNRALFNIEQALAYNTGKKVFFKPKRNSRKENKVLYERYLAINNVIKNHTKQISVLDNKAKNIDESIKQLEQSYNKQISDIKGQEQSNTIGYNALYVELDKLLKALKASYYETILTSNNQFDVYYKDYLLNRCLIPISSFIGGFENIIINFKDIEKNIYDTNVASIKIDLAKTIEQIEKETITIANIAKENFNKTNAIQLNQINNTTNELQAIEKKYVISLKQAEINYEKSMNEILEEKKNKLKEFYIELYAIDDNLHDIENDYTTFINNIDNQYNNDKDALLAKIEDKKNQIATNLDLFIKTKNELIKHLPIAIKLQIKAAYEEEKKKNIAIDIELEVEKKLLSEKKKTTKKNLSIIQSSHQSRINKIEFEHKKALLKEKRVYNNTANRIKHQ